MPLFDASAAPDAVKREWAQVVDRVLSSGRYIGGPEVDRFEREFADYTGTSFCVGVGNGLDAISLALEALGIGHGSRVAVPAHTFIATWLAVIRLGATPVAVDVRPDGQLDLDELFTHSEKLDAVVPVHMHGGVVDMPALMAWAEDRGILVVEDCAQAHGARIDGRHVGSWGHAGAFSFYPTKNLGAFGDAGAVVTSDKALADRIRSLGSYGSSQTDKYVHESLGWNSRLDPLQAALLSVSLSHLDEWVEARCAIAGRYMEALDREGARGLHPLFSDADASVWHHFVVTSPHRDAERQAAGSWGIATDIHYPRTAAAEIAGMLPNVTCDAPRADQLSREAFSLPIHPWMTESQVDLVCRFLASSEAEVAPGGQRE